MIRNYLITAIRNLLRNKILSILNIFGLALGIVSCLMIYIYVQDELSFDQHHVKADRIYRLQCHYKFEEVEDKFGITPFPIIPTLIQEYPEIETGTRLLVLGNQNINFNDRTLNMEHVYYADSNFFNVFDFHFLEGNMEKSLAEPGNVVMTKEYAIKIFGDEAPIGKIINWNQKTLKVTGIIDEKKFNTHIQLGMFIPTSAMNPEGRAQIMENWGNNNSFSYVVFKNSNKEVEFQEKLDAYIAKFISPEWEKFGFNGVIQMIAEPLKEIHFNNYLMYDSPKKGNLAYVKIFTMVAILILSIACINYINMVTASSSRRTKEVGIRKISGASRKQVIAQFVGESILVTFFALLVSFCLLEILLPFFNKITDKDIEMDWIFSPAFLFASFLILIFTGVIAGGFPAIFMSKFSPHALLKDGKVSPGRKNRVRKFLMTAQFSISMIMIFATFSVYLHLQFLRNTEMGFEKDNMLMVTIPPSNRDSTITKKIRDLKDELKKETFVKAASFTTSIPGKEFSRIVFKYKSSTGFEGKPIATLICDPDFPSMMNMKLFAGRHLNAEIKSDESNSILINESLVRTLNWDKPLEHSLFLPNDTGLTEIKVVGVLKDFNFASLHSPIEPLVVFMANPSFTGSSLMVKLTKGGMDGKVESIKNKWSQMLPNKEFEYIFLDSSLALLYGAEEKMFHVFLFFALLSLALSCMGIYGLSFFSTLQRTKEIGIRKVLGAPVSVILFLLNKEFLVMILVSVIFAFPVAAIIVNNWLSTFAYNDGLAFLLFPLTLLVIVLLSLLTVSTQVLKTVRQNPVYSLRHE